ncbi:transcription repressor OFP8-like [Rhododendron vialii]|uniref:transcription repressor OFP8-like n=1 Tax=Rhododendron vialii TaxID=182163 RepID=UPI00265F2656|nr:transcription repressor OFP8-like [Rhododendron vialii]
MDSWRMDSLFFSFGAKTQNQVRRERERRNERREEARRRVVVVDGKVTWSSTEKRRTVALWWEKQSSDPYVDFTTSMVEMIVEKQIFGARDLEDLLETFLSVNSHHHHRVIVEVFTEICDALFPNWSLFS